MIFVLPAPAIRECIHTLWGTLTDFDAAQGQSYHVTHEYVTNIYRKFGVSNRVTHMALWLGGRAMKYEMDSHKGIVRHRLRTERKQP